MRHYDEKLKNLNFDNHFLNMIFSKTMPYNMVPIQFAHSLQSFGGNHVSNLFL